MDARLHDSFEAAAQRTPDEVAVEELGGRSATYRELNDLADIVAHKLRQWPITPGARIAMLLPKSMEAVGAILGILKAGAAYVPVDIESPPLRLSMILNDCQPAAIILTAKHLKFVPEGYKPLPLTSSLLIAFSDQPKPLSSPPDLAYMLYTSGSTGQPKGVMLSHENAISFVDWCSEVFRPTRQDRFSSHAPFHFDLSVFDIFVCLKHSGTLVLIDPDAGRSPQMLAEIAAQKRITIWYSTPTTLTTMVEFGKMDRHNYDPLHTVLFAGEVFPAGPLHELRQVWPMAAFYNLYGPTETNVCTWFKLPDTADPERQAPYPIGWACSHCEVEVMGEDGFPAAQGELIVAGRPVMLGYHGAGELSRKVFIEHAGKRWYRTGDIVRRLDDGALEFIGRHDRMVKRRGYRIELGEIESALRKHPEVSEAAVTATLEGDVTRISAHICWHSAEKPSVVSIKQFCVENLPLYMIPDRIIFHASLPRTSTHKLDYQALLYQG